MTQPIALAPAESRGELTTLGKWVASEKNTLKALGTANWESLSISNLDSLLAQYPRLAPFKKAWDGLEARTRRRETYSGKTEVELKAVVEREKEKFISELSSWGRNLESRVAHLSQLEVEISALSAKAEVDLYSYLEVFSSYINHFGFEPSAVWVSGNSVFPTSVNPLRFTIHDLIERKDVFPDSIYLPTTKGLSLEEFNERFAAGIYPVGTVRGGKSINSDGAEFLSSHIIAAHNLTHLPLKVTQGGPRLLNARQIEINRRNR